MSGEIYFENLQKITDQLIERIPTQVVDESMRNFIFNDKKNIQTIVQSVPQHVHYMRNVFTLAFVFAYGCYRLDMEKPELDSVFKRVKEHNSLLIKNSLENAYVQYPITD